MGGAGSETSSLAGTPRRGMRSTTPSDTLPRTGPRHSGGMLDPRSSPRSSPDMRKLYYSRGSLDRQSFPRQSRAELKVVETLRQDDYRQSPTRHSEPSGLMPTPVFHSVSSGDAFAESPLSSSSGLSPLAKRHMHLRKPQSSLSQERSTSADLPSPGPETTRAASASPNLPRSSTSHAPPGTPDGSGRSSSAMSSYHVHDGDGPCRSEVLSPIEEGNSCTNSPAHHKKSPAAETPDASVADSSNTSRTLKSILRKAGSGSTEKGPGRPRPGVMFTGEISESSVSDTDYGSAAASSAYSQASSSPAVPEDSHTPTTPHPQAHTSAGARGARAYCWLSSLHNEPIMEASVEDDMLSPPPLFVPGGTASPLTGPPRLEVLPSPPECSVTERFTMPSPATQEAQNGNADDDDLDPLETAL